MDEKIKAKNKNKANTETESKEVIVRFHGRSVVYRPYQLQRSYC